jgi:hypothetical protein
MEKTMETLEIETSIEAPVTVDSPPVETVEKKITKQFSVIGVDETLKAVVEKDGLAKSGIWAYASVEIPDSVGDVVKIAGIDWSDYHNPPNKYLKITAQHAMELADGTPPIIGRVEKFMETKVTVDGKSVPALAFYMTWACDGSGAITALAQKYKDLFDGGYMESFSVGLLTDDYEGNESKGLNYNSSKIYHIGAVTVPANPMATKFKSIEKAMHDKVAELTTTVDKQHEIISKQSEMIAKMAIELDKVCNLGQVVEDSLKSASEDVQKRFDTLIDRLDEIEAGVVVKSTVPIPQTDDRKRDNAKDLSEISNLLKKYSGK